MRYCPECKEIHDGRGNACPRCGSKTEILEVVTEQLELFDKTKADLQKSILENMIDDLEAAKDDVTKSERKLRASIAAKNAAETQLLDFCKLEGIISSDEEDEDEEEEAYILPELPPHEDDEENPPEFLTWTEADEDPAEPVDPAADVPLIDDDDDEIRPMGDGFDG
jgi:hypothetical protein